MSEVVIALDVGGTKVAGAVVDAGGKIVQRTQAPTNATAGPEALMRTLIYMAARLRDAHPRVSAIGVGSAGQIDHLAGRVIYANENLPGWSGMAIRARIEAALGLPVAVDNDVNAVALGEAVYGAGAGRRVVLVVALGTGIGGALVLDGALFRGVSGVAGEIGHIPLTRDGPLCGCGNRGCLEAYAAGPRIAVAYAAAAGLTRSVDLPEVVAAARAGDATAQRVFAEAGWRLGLVLGGLANMLNPDAIVLGGGVMAAGDLLLAPLRAELSLRALGPAREAAEVMPAALGPDAGLIGAAVLALRAQESRREVPAAPRLDRADGAGR